MKSKNWLDRQKRDFYVNESKLKGYVSRSAFKFLEINKKFKLLKNSKYIFEFGSSPGGWSQVIFEEKSNVNIYAIDLLDMKFNHPKLKFFKKDFLNFDYSLIPFKFDLIVSDIAPNTTGHQSTDHLRISSMAEEIIDISQLIILPLGSLVLKIWKGSEEINIINKLKKNYKSVSYFKPNSSRSESSEIFIVAQKFINY